MWAKFERVHNCIRPQNGQNWVQCCYVEHGQLQTIYLVLHYSVSYLNC